MIVHNKKYKIYCVKFTKDIIYFKITKFQKGPVQKE